MALRTLAFLTLVQVIFGFELKTVDEWSIPNDLDTSNLHWTGRTVYQTKIINGSLRLRSIEKENSVNCIITDEKIDDSHLASKVKKLDAEKALVYLFKAHEHKLLIINTKSCALDEIIYNNHCEHIFTYGDTFDCIPYFDTEDATKYTSSGKLVRTYKNPVQKMFSEYHVKYAEFDEQKPNKSYFAWEKPVLDDWSTLTILNSTFGVARRDYLRINRLDKYRSLDKDYSVAHENFTTCDYVFDSDKQDYDINCTLVNWSVYPATNFTVVLPLSTKDESSEAYGREMAVHNLPEGGAFLLFNRGTKYTYYQIIDAQGRVLNKKEEVFYEFKSRLDQHRSDSLGIYLYEKENRVCGVMADLSSIGVKCVTIKM